MDLHEKELQILEINFFEYINLNELEINEVYDLYFKNILKTTLISSNVYIYVMVFIINWK